MKILNLIPTTAPWHAALPARVRMIKDTELILLIGQDLVGNPQPKPVKELLSQLRAWAPASGARTSLDIMTSDSSSLTFEM